MCAKQPPIDLPAFDNYEEPAIAIEGDGESAVKGGARVMTSSASSSVAPVEELVFPGVRRAPKKVAKRRVKCTVDTELADDVIRAGLQDTSDLQIERPVKFQKVRDLMFMVR